VTSTETPAFEGHVILELMGHRRLAGYLTEAQIGGATFLRLDIPAAGGTGAVATQFYAPAAVYCITPTDEATARAVASLAQVAPVSRWELPAPDHDEEIL
jgi:hypothetical protein